ncbi:MAG: hypothetical protein PVJ52_02340, partial [Candidatus Woesebacteria bacterium]
MKTSRGVLLPLVAILIALTLVVIGVFGYLFIYNGKGNIPTSKPTTTIATPTTINTNSSIPPLYPGVEWGEPEKGEYLFINESGETVEDIGYRVESNPT